MRMHRTVFHATNDRGPVGTTSGSGGAEHFVTPEESNKAHLKRPLDEPVEKTTTDLDSDVPPTPPRDDIG
jgi:hypothetical protein